MEQSLSKHLQAIRNTNIVVENMEVEKSQVILAAQDMIDSVHKMYIDVNDMMVKELPALVDSIQSEMGVNESDAYNSAVSQSLKTLNDTLNETQNSLKAALQQLTGQEASGSFGDEEMGGDMNMDANVDMSVDDAAPEMPAPELDLPDVDDLEGLDQNAGRARR
jgi:hypothetical protein